MGGGDAGLGPTAVHILHLSKSQLQNLSTSQKISTFLHTQTNFGRYFLRNQILFISWKAKRCQLHLWY
mgnify:CR=1 FL=1